MTQLAHNKLMKQNYRFV